MKSHDRTPLGAIDETPPMPVADASARAATHVATLPREDISPSADRHARGLRALGDITGATGESVVESLRDMAPDLADWIVDFSYGDVMSRPVATCSEDQDVFDAIQTMRAHGVRRLPMLNAGGDFAGFVSADDIFGALATEFRGLSGALVREQAREIETRV